MVNGCIFGYGNVFRLVLFFVFVAWPTFSVIAESDPKSLEVSPDRIVLGVIKDKSNPTVTLTVRNPLTVPVTIHQIVGGCGCELQTALPLEVAPSSTAKVLMKIITEGYKGSVDQIIRLFSSHPSQPFVSVPVNFIVEKLIGIAPEIIHVPEIVVSESEKFSRDLVIESSAISAIKAQFSGSKLRVVNITKGQNKTNHWIIKIAPFEVLPIGEIRDRLFIISELANGEKLTDIVPVYLVVKPLLSFSKQRVNFGLSQIEETIKVSVLGERVISVLRAKSSSPLVAVELVEKIKGRQYELKVKLDRNELREPLRSLVNFEGDGISDDYLPQLQIAATVPSL
jgi:hypothetical protein